MNLTMVKHLIRWIKNDIINVIDWRINIGKMNEFEIMIGKNIKEVRTQKELSQEVLAKKCGFSNTTLSSYENSRKIPSLTTIATIIEISYFINIVPGFTHFSLDYIFFRCLTIIAIIF